MAHGAQLTAEALCNRPPNAINRKPTVILLTPLTYGVQYLFAGLGHVPNWGAWGFDPLGTGNGAKFLDQQYSHLYSQGKGDM
jgi:hypothetical protein